MYHRGCAIKVVALFFLTCAALPSAAAMDVVRDGKPLATIVVDSAVAPPSSRRQRSERPADLQAAAVLVDWVRKMTDAELPIAPSAPKGSPAIYIGAAAVKAGLRLDDLQSPSREGLRIQGDGRRLLLAGQNETATVKAVCRLLEHWGCRYFLDHPLGEVYPRTRTLTVGKLDLTEKPGFVYRSIWGSQWGGPTLWKTWNGAGGVGLSMGHAWGQYVPQELFAQHPEYFHLRHQPDQASLGAHLRSVPAARRQPSDWYCTSNPGLREVFTQGVIDRIKAGALHPSISPPDGTGYCECDACRAQDDPKSLEPSSGHVSVTNRYLDFYQHVARRVAQASPESILSFYCYADYTQAPTSGVKLEPNLCAWIAPIRYCRFHRIGQPGCASRLQLGQLIDDWGAAAGKIAYRTYNYNLAECVVPFSMISVWKHDIPYLKQKGCIGVNLETLANWQIYGPHIYLSIRLAYDPGADADAIMEDYYLNFYGPKAGPIMKEYWTAIDRAFVDLPSHAGSFFAIHLVYTPELLRQCRDLIERAATAAEGDATYAARVRMTAEGLRNAEQYIALRQAVNRGDFAGAKRVYDDLLARSQVNQQAGLGNHYTVAYLERFLGKHVEAGAAATAPPNKLVQVLPDLWRMAYDEADRGLEEGFQQPGLDDSSWREVATYGKPLDAQGLPDRQTVLWYRTRFQLPEGGRKLALFFTEVDGDASLYLNGKAVAGSQRKRVPFEVDVTGAAAAGENVLAVRVDHRKITELFLGGIIRPVLLTEKGP